VPLYHTLKSHDDGKDGVTWAPRTSLHIGSKLRAGLDAITDGVCRCLGQTARWRKQGVIPCRTAVL
jgi:hypothetical protein